MFLTRRFLRYGLATLLTAVVLTWAVASTQQSRPPARPASAPQLSGSARSGSSSSPAAEAWFAVCFPYLGHNFQVLGPATPTYTCIAHTLGIHNRVIFVITGPPSDPFSYMDQLYLTQGYRRLPVPDASLQSGQQKIVLYGTLNPNGSIRRLQHAALQMPDGNWSSKIGTSILIRHLVPQALNGPEYGQPVAVYARAVGYDPAQAVLNYQQALLGNDPASRRRAALALSLRGISAQQAVPVLIAVLRDKNSDGRAEAAWALG